MPLVGVKCCKGGERDFEGCIHDSLYTDTCQYMAPIIIAMSQNQEERKDAGNLSATGLLGCPRFNELKPHLPFYESPAEYYARFRGTVSHAMVEYYVNNFPGTIVERRVQAEVNGIPVSGKMDLVVPGWTLKGNPVGLVTDYKSTNKRASSVPLKDDHKFQVNIYAWLLRNGYFTDTGEKVGVDVKYGQINYVEMQYFKTYTFPLMWPHEQDELVEELVSDNAGWDFASGELPEILPMQPNGQPHWRCRYCPLMEECFAIGDNGTSVDWEDEEAPDFIGEAGLDFD
jgi:CRISPR/Cas system-associated exonuclease Cas4 (RecB family)